MYLFCHRLHQFRPEKITCAGAYEKPPPSRGYSVVFSIFTIHLVVLSAGLRVLSYDSIYIVLIILHIKNYFNISIKIHNLPIYYNQNGIKYIYYIQKSLEKKKNKTNTINAQISLPHRLIQITRLLEMQHILQYTRQNNQPPKYKTKLKWDKIKYNYRT